MLIGTLCTIVCSATLAIIPNPIYDPNSEGTITLLGHPIGRYVDNEQPNQCGAVQAELAQGVPLVIAGQAPGSDHSCPGAVNAREWFPFDCHRPRWAWGPFPHWPVLILQATFAWPGCQPPSDRQARRLLQTAVADHVRLTLRY